MSPPYPGPYFTCFTTVLGAASRSSVYLLYYNSAVRSSVYLLYYFACFTTALAHTVLHRSPGPRTMTLPGPQFTCFTIVRLCTCFPTCFTTYIYILALLQCFVEKSELAFSRILLTVQFPPLVLCVSICTFVLVR